MTKPLFSKKILSTLYLCAPVLILAPDFAAAAGFGTLVPHRAVYDVVLEAAEDRSGIKGMSGRIVYEVRGNECDGITVQYRFVTNVVTAKNQFLTDQQTSTYESPDGKEFSFQTKSFVNEVADANVQGSAQNLESGIKVSLLKPEKRELDLVKGMFVSTHLVQVIEEAKAGRHFFQKDIFDGSGKGDEVMASTSVIGNPKSFPKPLKGEKADVISKFEGQTAWPVTISYFKHATDNTGESLPMYEAAFLLYENGISRKLVMTYPDYSLRADLQELELLDRGVCK